MKRIIYSSLSVLTAIGTVFVAAKAEVFNRDGAASKAGSEEVVALDSAIDEANNLAKLPDAFGDNVGTKGGLLVPADGKGGDLANLSGADLSGGALLRGFEKPQKAQVESTGGLSRSSVRSSATQVRAGSSVGTSTEPTDTASITPITISSSGAPQALPSQPMQARSLPARAQPSQSLSVQTPRQQTTQQPAQLAQSVQNSRPTELVGQLPETQLPETAPTAKPSSGAFISDEPTEATAGDPDASEATTVDSPAVVPGSIGIPLPSPGFSEPATSQTPVPANGVVPATPTESLEAVPSGPEDGTLMEGDAVEEDSLDESAIEAEDSLEPEVDALDGDGMEPGTVEMPQPDGIEAYPEASPIEEDVSPSEAAPVAPPTGIEGTEAAPVPPAGIEETEPAPVAPPTGIEEPGAVPVTPPTGIEGVEESPVAPPGEVPGAPIEGVEEAPEGLGESEIEDNMPAGEDPEEPLDAPVPAAPPGDIPSDVPPAGAPIPEPEAPGAPVPGPTEGMPPGPTDGLPSSPAPVTPVEPLPPVEEDALPGEPVPGPTSDSGNRLIGEGFTPFQLSYLAISGGLNEEGIPGGTRLLAAYEAGSLSAEDVVEAGALSNKLGTAASDEEDFTKSVDNFLKMLVRDSRAT
ncbi:MAG: hypothetical protein AAFS06_16795 [Cyanobacteria bacterium J06631_12]